MYPPCHFSQRGVYALTTSPCQDYLPTPGTRDTNLLLGLEQTFTMQIRPGTDIYHAEGPNILYVRLWVQAPPDRSLRVRGVFGERNLVCNDATSRRSSPGTNFPPDRALGSLDP